MTTAPRILVIEDDRDVAALVARWLTAEGCDVTCHAGLGDVTPEGLAGADCLVVDLRLTDSAPRQTMVWAAAQRHARPVVVITGQVDVPEAAALGRSRIPVMMKPLGHEDVLSAVLAAATDAAITRLLSGVVSGLRALLTAWDGGGR